MIEDLRLSLYPSDELFTFSERAIQLVGEKTTAIPVLLPFHQNSTKFHLLFQQALEHEKKNPYTETLNEKNLARSEAFLAWRFYLQSASHRKIEGWHDAANKILDVVKQLGWSAPSMGYKAESAAIINIIDEVTKKFLPDSDTVKAGELFQELIAAEDDFDGTVTDSVKNQPTDQPIITTVRPDLTDSLTKMFSMVSLLNSSASTPDLKALESALNELIKQSLPSVKAARTRAYKKKHHPLPPTQSNVVDDEYAGGEPPE